ncbi:MAG TPA: TonB-dependent receptor, partial [Erythrobacter sp.]|nr:TonB-dependent receptor [Erythrobacter sp.]
DVTWLATDSLELTAGARLLEENRKSAYRSNVPDAVLSGAPLIPGQIDTGGRLFSAEDSFSALLPRFNALYRISNDANVFATVSKGRRSPVVQMGARVDDAG